MLTILAQLPTTAPDLGDKWTPTSVAGLALFLFGLVIAGYAAWRATRTSGEVTVIREVQKTQSEAINQVQQAQDPAPAPKKK